MPKAACPDCGHDRSQHWGAHERTSGAGTTSACLNCMDEYPGAGFPTICCRTASTIMISVKERPHGTYGRYFHDKCRCDDCKAYQRVRVAMNRADRLAEKRLTHGTRSAYDAGCRCDDCLGVRAEVHKREYYQEDAVHNHITRDIKPLGKCPGCDHYHHKRKGH